MPGQRINDQQYNVYIINRRKKVTQVTSAAKAGFCERSGRTLEKGGIAPSQKKKKSWRRRGDPFTEVWDSIIVPLLEASPFLTGINLLEHLQDLYPGEYVDKHLRCLQKRIKHWKALHGPTKEVMFRQLHPPGLRGISDFTLPKRFEVTIQGKKLDHILYHFRLTYSQWAYVKVVLGGESFSALATGLQEALESLGGSPEEHRTDSLSAAFKNLGLEDCEDVTRRYEAFCRHYGMRATRNNRGKGHENGSIEAGHGYLKSRLHQGLALRGSNDFTSIEKYQSFLDSVVGRHNRRHALLIEEEKKVLTALPAHKACDFDEVIARVTTSSTVTVKKVLYSVPSKLIGERLKIHVYDQYLSFYLGNEHVLKLSRVFSQTGQVKKCIDYRHIIGGLIKKPQAFRYSVLRDEMLPTADYQEIWRLIDEKCSVRHACKLIVGILKLANDYNCEKKLGERVLRILKKDLIPSLGELQRRYEAPPKTKPPVLAIPQHSLKSYDELHSAEWREAAHA